MDKYKLIFRGQLKEGKDQAAIGKFLCKFLGIAETNAEKLFSGRAYALKSNLPQQQAYDLQGKLDQAGILTDVIREKPLQNDVTYQEKVIQTEQGRERVAEPDYKMLVGDKTLCRHCGSHLSDTKSPVNSEPKQLLMTSAQNAPSEKQAISTKKSISMQDIEVLDVSDWWKERFALLYKSGAAQMGFLDYFYTKGIKQLTVGERLKLQFYFVFFIGFLIGPFIYFLKGMYRKGFFLVLLNTLLCSVIDVVSYELDKELPLIFYSLIGACVVQQFYVFDYFKYQLEQETFWPELPAWLGNGFAITSGFLVTIGFYTLWLNDYL